MKRSSKLKLTLMMGLAGGLSGCGESDESALIFKNPDDCSDYGVEQQACEAQYQQALASHEQEAPKYANQQLCESDFGFQQCEGSGSFWRPLMAGFMIAKVADMVGDSFKRKRYASLSGSYYNGGKPLYRSRDDYFSFRNANNQFVAPLSNRGTTMVKKSAVHYSPKVKSVTRSRGGFGKSASSRSFGG